MRWQMSCLFLGYCRLAGLFVSKPSASWQGMLAIACCDWATCVAAHAVVHGTTAHVTAHMAGAVRQGGIHHKYHHKDVQ